MIEKLKTRSQAYQQTFNNPIGERVLADLKRFCMANKTTFVPGDPHASAFGEGRREVWLRIMAYINLTEREISKLKE